MVPILELIPLASLAALVMAVGIQMVSLHHIRTVTRHREALVYAVTTLGVVFLGVLEGVTLGIAVAVAVALHRLTRTRITHDEKEGVHHVHVRGQLTFLAVPRLSRALHHVPQGSHVVVELDGSFMDHAAYEALQDWQKTHTAQGGTVELTGRRVATGTDPGTADPDATSTGTGTGTHADTDTASAPHTAHPTLHLGSARAECQCRPWTPWRNHRCEVPRLAPPAAASGQHPGRHPDRQPGQHPSRHPDRHGDAPRPTEAGQTTDPSVLTPLGGTSAPAAPLGGRQLVHGITAFQRNTAPLVRGELARLAKEGQRPTQLFLTCADSRLVTSMITSSGPGDLFVVRNVGNLVPPPGEESGDDSVAAAIEYAVDVLHVRSITVCGHSGCGAMQALLQSDPGQTQTPLRRWLRLGVPSLERMADDRRPWPRLAGRAAADAVEQLCLTNVVQQLEHLRAHESVARALRSGELELHGLYFHVGEAQAYLLQGQDEGAVFDHVGAVDLTA